ncbi:MAG: PhnD/SsuA/transferrin family substrate-binding protein [Verrucomicrobiales bacterium]
MKEVITPFWTGICKVLPALIVTAVATTLINSAHAELIKVGYPLNYANESVKKDMRLAISYLIKKALERDGVQVEFAFTETREETLQLLLSGRIDIAEIGGLNYATLPVDQKALLVPCLVPQRAEEPLETYILLGPAGETMDTLSGKRILTVRERYRGLSLAWLNSIAQGMPLVLDSCGEPSEAVLQTFFGKAQACVVSKSDFSLLCELNPQLARRLSVIATSKPLLPLLLVHSVESASRIDVPRAIETAVHLQDTPEGQQAFTMMKMKSFVRYSPHYVIDTEDMVNGGNQVGLAIKGGGVDNVE